MKLQAFGQGSFSRTLLLLTLSVCTAAMGGSCNGAPPQAPKGKTNSALKVPGKAGGGFELGGQAFTEKTPLLAIKNTAAQPHVVSKISDFQALISNPYTGKSWLFDEKTLKMEILESFVRMEEAEGNLLVTLPDKSFWFISDDELSYGQLNATENPASPDFKKPLVDTRITQRGSFAKVKEKGTPVRIVGATKDQLFFLVGETPVVATLTKSNLSMREIAFDQSIKAADVISTGFVPGAQQGLWFATASQILFLKAGKSDAWTFSAVKYSFSGLKTAPMALGIYVEKTEETPKFKPTFKGGIYAFLADGMFSTLKGTTSTDGNPVKPVPGDVPTGPVEVVTFEVAAKIGEKGCAVAGCHTKDSTRKFKDIEAAGPWTSHKADLITRLKNKNMPPSYSSTKITDDERAKLINYLEKN
jgi:hypothetical protein